MDTAMTQEELKEMLDGIVREVTEQTAGVTLFPGGELRGERLYTVYITFNRGFHTSLTLCSDEALLIRMARNALELKEPTSQELEDFCKEYFNILCGKIAAVLFRNTRIPARFSVPRLYEGRYMPEDHCTQFILTYADEYRDGVQLIHHVPRNREEGTLS
ncbi:MAG: hypothetical protein HDT14_09315 [Oscillibacter sp.]|nr:hypothetical protein [Oscillibacter sp.]